MKYFAEIIVTLKNGIRDPQGSVVETILKRMDIDEDSKVSTGKYFTLSINAQDQSEAEHEVNQICSEILANTVLESYKIMRLEQV